MAKQRSKADQAKAKAKPRPSAAAGDDTKITALTLEPAPLSPEMAVRLSLAFGTSAESWLNHQLQYDLWQLQKQRKNLRVVKFAA